MDLPESLKPAIKTEGEIHAEIYFHALDAGNNVVALALYDLVKISRTAPTRTDREEAIGALRMMRVAYAAGCAATLEASKQ